MTTTFADLGVPEELVGALADAGITEPFPVQSATIPDGLAGRDVSGKAPTGSGKTLAFGLPMLSRIRSAEPHRPTGMILAPTRELAEQIYNELKPLAKAGDRSVTAIYGGVAYGPQRSAMKNAVDIVVATPGRLGDLIDEGDVALDDVEMVVIDEADRMADMGFLPVVKWLLHRTPKDRQTLLFSATLDGDVAALSYHFQNDPVLHEVEGLDTDTTDARHFFWRVEHTARTQAAVDVVDAINPTIIFCETRNGADRVARQLKSKGVKAEAIHGGRPQNYRNRALQKFTDGKVDALVATDVAARGIHVDGVESVVHYDPPKDVKAYLHRSGRTARAGASGVVVSLVRDDQTLTVQSMQRQLGLEVGLEEPDLEGLTGAGGQKLTSQANRPRKPKPRRRRRLL